MKSIRENVLEFVNAHDGCTMADIEAGLGLNGRQVTYAVAHLTKIGCLRSDRTQHYPAKNIFTTGNPIVRKKPYYPPTRNRHSPNAEEIYAYLSEHPNATVSQIDRDTRFCESVIRFALRRLEREGRVERDTIDFNACRGMEQKWRCL